MAAAFVIGTVSIVYRWGALDSGKGIFILIAFGAAYGAIINTYNDYVNDILERALWEIALSAVGVTLLTAAITSLLMWITVKIFDHPQITKIGKAFFYIFMAGALGGSMFFLIWQVIPSHLFIEVIASPFKSIPYIWIALLPGMLVMRWAEDV
jgi:hypothetical protein